MSLTPVLILAYFFPPLGGAGTQRPAKFAKWLPSFGYQPVVVAADPAERPAAAPNDDPTLAEEVRDTPVLRVPAGTGPRPSLARRLALAAKFRQDDEEWVARAAPVVDQAIRTHAPAAVIITVSPYAAAELGPWIARRHNLPWVLDLRDPWVLDGWFVPTTRIHGIWHRRVMVRLLRAANLVIANTPAAREAFIAMAQLPAGKVWTIPNGYDPDDLIAAGQAARHNGEAAGGGEGASDTQHFRLIHVGTLYSANPPQPGLLRQLVRGPREQIDETGRSGRYLFEAMAVLKQRRPELFARLRLELVGQVHPSHQRLAESLGITPPIRSIGYLPHTAALRRMLQSDAVFVPLHGVYGGPALIVPGKTYEAVASGRFVLGSLPDGDAARLIRMAGAGAVCRPDDREALASELADLIHHWVQGRPRTGAAPGTVEAFTRRQLTARLARGLDLVRGIGGASDYSDPWDEIGAGKETPAGLSVR